MAILVPAEWNQAGRKKRKIDTLAVPQGRKIYENVVFFINRNYQCCLGQKKRPEELPGKTNFIPALNFQVCLARKKCISLAFRVSMWNKLNLNNRTPRQI